MINSKYYIIFLNNIYFLNTDITCRDIDGSTLSNYVGYPTGSPSLLEFNIHKSIGNDWDDVSEMSPRESCL